METISKDDIRLFTDRNNRYITQDRTWSQHVNKHLFGDNAQLLLEFGYGENGNWMTIENQQKRNFS